MAILNPRSLAQTNVQTSSPLSLEQSLPLFPIPGETRVARAALDPTGTLLSKSVGDRIAGASVNIGYDIFLGVAGPAWATEVQVQGEYGAYDQGGNALFFSSTSGDQLLAGFVFGASMGLNVTISANLGPADLNETFSVTADLIALIELVISAAVGSSTDFGKVNSALTAIYPQLGSSWGLTGFSQGSYARNRGSLSANAPLNIPINIWGMLVTAAEVAGDFFGVGEAITAANDAFSATGSSLTIGPVFGFGVTVTPQITGLTLDDVQFGGVAFGGTSMTGGTSSALPSNPTRVGFVFEQKNTFDFQIGLTSSLTLLAFFTLGASLTLDVTGLLEGLGVPALSLGTFTQSLQSPIANAVAARPVTFV